MNKIEEARAEIRKYFDPQNLIEGSSEIQYSPNRRFCLTTSNYRQTKPGLNWNSTKVEILNNDSGEPLFEFITNDDHFFHDWLIIEDTEYFVCAEDIYGGQTVLDLTNQRMASYSSGEDGFIWTKFYLSPDGRTLATIGCFWAAPFVIKVYDFSRPLDLPLRELKEIDLIGTENILGWIDNKSFKTKGIQTEMVKEYLNDGSFRFKEVGEIEIERVFRVD